MWDLSCPDWQDRLRAGRSLIPKLDLVADEAKLGLAFFDEMRLPDVPSKPRLGDAAGQWYRDLVRAAFGSWDGEQRFIRDILAMVPKASSKTSYSAGLILAVMLMNRRPRAEALFIGPTQSISDRAYEQAVGMIEESPDLRRRFRPRDHIKTIEDLANNSEMKVKTFDLNILTGSILIFALLDELHLLGRNAHTGRVLRQIRGGLDKTAEGLLLMITTQSDDVPAGTFRDELHMARRIRDGEFRGRIHRPMLPLLYEFPDDIAHDQNKWENTDNWPMVMPNLGRSVHMSDLVPSWETEKTKGDAAIRIWASQHLNIEIGIGLRTNGWPGAEFWQQAEDTGLDQLESVLQRSDTVIVGIDGGGLDDLFGLCVLGREKTTRNWLAWSHAWCHVGVLKRRQTIAARLHDFANAGELTIVDDELGDISQIIDIIRNIRERGLLSTVSVDPAGLGEFIEALLDIGISQEGGQLVGAPQGYGLMNAIKTCERKLANGTLKHSPSRLMSWCVSNIKIEPTATAIRATKQNAGDAKIDPAMALFDAATAMMRAPEAPKYQMFFV